MENRSATIFREIKIIFLINRSVHDEVPKKFHQIGVNHLVLQGNFRPYRCPHVCLCIDQTNYLDRSESFQAKESLNIILIDF